MSTEVTLPALGESVTEGTVSRWLKAVGDRVEADEPLLEVSTDKVDTEIPSPAAGVLLEIRVNEDEVAEVGAVLGVVGEESEAGQSAPQAAAPAPEAAAPAPESIAQAPAQEAPSTETPGAVEPDTQPVAAPAAPAASAGQGTEVTLPALGESVT
ncbi:MAG TPA: biotin/lipoyl-containing protein, partial [Propionibacteriaceae bacterium]|nr:biotin/lipoyl-containing protein [Propionibacteriaceae bacterium]